MSGYMPNNSGDALKQTLKDSVTEGIKQALDIKDKEKEREKNKLPHGFAVPVLFCVLMWAGWPVRSSIDQALSFVGLSSATIYPSVPYALLAIASAFLTVELYNNGLQKTSVLYLK